jgi:hypothetical protein
LSNSTISAESVTRQLCLKCGLCCNGVIFADVELRRSDDANRLRALGIPISNSGQGKFRQPCQALDGCRCQIYNERPQHCRQFECLLFKNVLSEKIKPGAALRIIKKAKVQADIVRVLLEELGDTNEQIALRIRFRQVAATMTKKPAPGGAADRYSRLTLAMQKLDVLLSEDFYPGG